MYQKTFMNKEVEITTKTRTWYTIVDKDELSSLNIDDVCFIDCGNSFLKKCYTKGQYMGSYDS